MQHCIYSFLSLSLSFSSFRGNKKNNKRKTRRHSSLRFTEKIRRHFSQTNIADFTSPSHSPRLPERAYPGRGNFEKNSHLARSVANLLEEKVCWERERERERERETKRQRDREAEKQRWVQCRVDKWLHACKLLYCMITATPHLLISIQRSIDWQLLLIHTQTCNCCICTET